VIYLGKTIEGKSRENQQRRDRLPTSYAKSTPPLYSPILWPMSL
jgi:hypothetical protein